MKQEDAGIQKGDVVVEVEKVKTATAASVIAIEFFLPCDG